MQIILFDLAISARWLIKQFNLEIAVVEGPSGMEYDRTDAARRFGSVRIVSRAVKFAEQSEQLVVTGITAAEDNRLLSQQVDSLERVARQYLVLRNEDSLNLLQQDAEGLEQRIEKMSPLAEKANADSFARSILVSARRIVANLSDTEFTDEAGEAVVAEFATLRQRVTRLSLTLSNHIELELNRLQDSTRRAQQVSAWQTAALVPGTLILVLFFTLLVAKPIRQIDRSQRPRTARPPAGVAQAALAGIGRGKEPFSQAHVA